MQSLHLLAAATWEDVVPFIAMATAPLGSAIAILWKKNTALQDKLLEQAEKILPLATQITGAVSDVVVLVEKVQERTPTQAQIDRFNKNMERLSRMARER